MNNQIDLKDYLFYLHENQQFMVGIRADGGIDFGENYRPDAAAKVFWNCMVQYMPNHPENVVKNMANEIANLLPKDVEGYSTCQLIARWCQQKAKTFNL